MRLGKKHQDGFGYVAALFMIALLGIGLAKVAQATADRSHREREAQLIREGLDVMRAVRRYYYASPGSVRALPKEWDDLLEDKRFVTVRRHLRQVPIDPFSFTREWNVLRDPDGSLIGIASKSEADSFRTLPVVDGAQSVTTGGPYSGWRFEFEAAREQP